MGQEGKGRYPYPVGYQVARAHNGTTINMEILEGVNGPKFLISSSDGNSASGKTPQFAWLEFQKKERTRIKILHRNRLSPKMDALELFGFKNQIILRLLRRLVADIHRVAEQSPSLLLKAEDDKVTQSRSKESQGCIDIDLWAPDTQDLQEKISDSVPSNLAKNNDSEPTCEAVSEDLLNSKHEEVLKSDSNISLEKDYFNSAGKDVAKSMMSLLLPQAVPLLMNNSTDEKFTLIPLDILPSKEEQNEVGCVLDVPSSDKMVTEDAYEEQNGKVHKPDAHLLSNSSNTVHMKSTVLDSFEYSQCEGLKNSEVLSFDIAEVGRSSFSKEMCCVKSQEQLCGDLPKGPSSCCASEVDFKNRPHDYDLCIPDSVLDDMSPPDVCVPDSDLDDKSPPGVCVPDSDLDDMSPPGVCVPDSDLDDTSPPDVCVPDSDLDESPAHDSFKSVQNDLPVAQDFTGEKMQDEAVGKIGNAKTLAISSSQSPNFVYTRRKRQNSVTLQRNYSAMESTECDKTELVTTPQMHTAHDSVPPSKTIQAKNDKLCKPDDSAGLILEKPEVHSDVPDVQNNPAELNLSSQNPNPFSCENKCSGGKEAQFISEPMVQRSQKLKNNLNGNVKFVGRYMHPMPVSSLLLKTVEDEIHVCVLCGLLTDQHRTLFTYKVAIKELNFGCPSVMAHTPIMLPDPYNFMRETMVERTGVELTPDGQFIVLIGSIKTPNCRERKIDCCCSTCTSICSKKNGLKIVHVESGYVSVVATLEAVEDLHCILVCEPNRLVSVGGSGSVQVWVMNSTWSEKIEYFILPSVGSMSPGIVELKRVPKCAHLVVGRNVYGDFSLWDITKLNCVSSFSASKYPINEFFPISLFHLQTKGLGLSYASMEEMAEKLLEASNFWHSKQRETCVYLPTEDIAMWFLVSTPSDFDCCQDHVSTSIHHDVHTARSWRLALLMENSIAFGSPLDPRTTGVGVSGGYGIMSTSDGVVYMWDLSRGSKLDTLHHFQDDTITSIVTDDLNSNSTSVMGVAGGGGQLLLYLHLRDRDSNE
ncbi:uncharacterized protein LOC127126306 isoform X2 [Lathyrus oleraceus]|uniref:uncharacterized protein LOC127126306 isoform X2 n=1 Tax=Pisum sativum TaxID=3888 RepID=UPI0021CFCF2C|nr:uncharacterized protein LOC127126306 isoform X2 [Pisum sativum]